jgi:hypothetical protein
MDATVQLVELFRAHLDTVRHMTLITISVLRQTLVLAAPQQLAAGIVVQQRVQMHVDRMFI